MPIYEYECEKCHNRFELKRSFGEDGGASCPHCRGKACRIFTSVPVIFKGSGFYVTDHRKGESNSHPDKKEDKKATGTEPTVTAKKDGPQDIQG